MRKWTARVMAVLALTVGVATAAAAPAGAAPAKPADQHVSHVYKPLDWWWK